MSNHNLSRLCLPFLGISLLFGVSSVAKAGNVDFNRDVRPILSEHCFRCHGPDSGSREADLRLDLPNDKTRKELGDSRESSSVLKRVHESNPDRIMPPPEIDKPLTDADKELLARWIEEGASYEEHWAYAPVVRPPLPILKAGSIRHPVDAFIQAKLEQEGLDPAAQASPELLVRRLYLDLHGMMPSLAELNEALAWMAEPGGYHRLVEDLLSRPAFGERMAVWWLDLARFADTVGYHGDQPYPVWPFRDYVVNAFNQNLPFDVFTREQLAGDLLPAPGNRELIASGFNRLNMITAEGGAQPKEYLVKYAADRVRTTATTWLGATMGCAECHDHKYDPYTMEDFYSLAAFFADLDEQGFYGGANRTGMWGPSIQLPTPEETARKIDLSNEIQRVEATLKTMTPQLAGERDAWIQRFQALDQDGFLDWLPLRPLHFQSKSGTPLLRDEAFTLQTGEGAKGNDVYEITLASDRGEVSALRLEVLPHGKGDAARMGANGGNFILTGIEVEVLTGDSAEPVKVPLAKAIADYEQGGFPIAAAIDGKSNTGWAVDGHKKTEPRTAVFHFENPVMAGPQTGFIVRLRHEHEQKNHLIGKFRLSLSSIDRPTLDPVGLPAPVLKAVRAHQDQSKAVDSAAVDRHFLATVRSLDDSRSELPRLREQLNDLDDRIQRMLVSRRLETPRVIRILPRGNWMDESGREVQPAVPAFLNRAAQDETRLSRLDLANWLTRADNPLTSRVLVNRVWKLFFGRGIAPNLDDMGSQGRPPTHPELLDWLASDLMDRGWDIKQLIRTLVSSDAYQRSSNPGAELVKKDPSNQWFARQGSFRMDAEFLRDAALQAGGLLVCDLGGPSVKPYQPADYYAQLNFPKRTYEADTGSRQYRRGLYTHWQRTFLHPAMKAFDAPSREECTAERPRSNTPLQALVLLNDPSFVEAAVSMASRFCTEDPAAVRGQLTRAFQCVTSRVPEAQELDLLENLLKEHQAQFEAHPDSIQGLLKMGQGPFVESGREVTMAAWTSVCRALLNLQEFVTRY